MTMQILRKTKAIIAIALLFSGSSFAQDDAPFKHPVLSDSASWSLILLPDLQNYVKFERNQPILDVMMNWIADQQETLNIQMVMCTGDLVEHDDIVNPDWNKMDQTGKQQWEVVARAFEKLDGKIPYITATGNHDYNIFSYTHKPKTTHFPDYFPADKNRKNQRLLREVADNIYGKPSLENAAYEWRSPHGQDFLFLSLEFAPRDTIISWAKEVVSQEKYKSHQVIMLTHSYLNYKNEHIKTEAYDLQDTNYGLAMWEKLVKPSKNINMVLSGHIGGKNNARKHVAFRKDKNSANNTVNQMTFNAQAMGGGHYGSGGDGWLRILEFMPDGKTVKVKTYSPFFALSTTTEHLAWRSEDFDEFTMQIDY